MQYSIRKIAEILNVNNGKLNETLIDTLLTDSRQSFLIGNVLFFALITPNNDGHKYVSDLYDRGVKNFVVTRIFPEWKYMKDANFLIVKNTLDALQRLAAYHRKQFDIPVIGITGSNGKTVVKEWLFQVLHDKFHITHSPRSYNSQLGVPLSVWQMSESTELGIFEAGISECEEMFKLENIIHPTIGIITNIGTAHQEGFKSMRQKCLEKLELFIHSQVIICEEENKLIDECMELACLSIKRLTWSRKGSPKSPLHILKLEKDKNSTIIHYAILGFVSKVVIPFTDNASIENVINVMAAAIYLHLPFEELNEKLSQLIPVAMRLDVRSGRNNCTLVNDFYNSDINSLGIALDFLTERATKNKAKKVLILSDIPLSGMSESEVYKKVAELINEHHINLFIGIGNVLIRNKKNFHNVESRFYSTTKEFLNSNLISEFTNMFILIKGAREFLFENINRVLELKTHETVLDVNLDAIVHNYKFYRSKINPTTKMIAMVKANGYGAGAAEIAKTLQYHKCDYLAVAVAEEGVCLRREGINLPILILNPEVSEFDELVTYMLEPEVYNFKIFEAYKTAAARMGITNYPIHVKIDTGMHRLGFSEEDVPELIAQVKNQAGLRIQSVFSHLAASESWVFDEFTTQQIQTFKNISNSIINSFNYPILRHILNSAGIERFPDEQMDMVRLGISLYGISASGLSGLQDVCTLKTTILQIKHIKAGETVGYGRKGLCEKDTVIATIRIGYADGYSRNFGNGIGFVSVNGTRVPVLGNICMDLTMIDITGLNVREGDSVIIFGKDIPIIELAEKIGTIPYELLTSISNRVKHIYYKE